METLQQHQRTTKWSSQCETNSQLCSSRELHAGKWLRSKQVKTVSIKHKGHHSYFNLAIDEGIINVCPIDKSNKYHNADCKCIFESFNCQHDKLYNTLRWWLSRLWSVDVSHLSPQHSVTPVLRTHPQTPTSWYVNTSSQTLARRHYYSLQSYLCSLLPGQLYHVMDLDLLGYNLRVQRILHIYVPGRETLIKLWDYEVFCAFNERFMRHKER